MNITELAADLHDRANRLAAFIETPDIEALRDELGQVAEVIVARPIGREPAGAEPTRTSPALADQVRSLSSDTQQLANRLQEAGGGATVRNNLTASALGLRDLANELKDHAVGLQYVPSAEARKLNTRPVAGTTAGARPRSLDIAARDFENALRARNRQR